MRQQQIRLQLYRVRIHSYTRKRQRPS